MYIPALIYLYPVLKPNQPHRFPATVGTPAISIGGSRARVVMDHDSVLFFFFFLPSFFLVRERLCMAITAAGVVVVAGPQTLRGAGCAQPDTTLTNGSRDAYQNRSAILHPTSRAHLFGPKI